MRNSSDPSWITTREISKNTEIWATMLTVRISKWEEFSWLIQKKLVQLCKKDWNCIGKARCRNQSRVRVLRTQLSWYRRMRNLQKAVWGILAIYSVPLMSDYALSIKIDHNYYNYIIGYRHRYVIGTTQKDLKINCFLATVVSLSSGNSQTYMITSLVYPSKHTDLKVEGGKSNFLDFY